MASRARAVLMKGILMVSIFQLAAGCGHKFAGASELEYARSPNDSAWKKLPMDRTGPPHREKTRTNTGMHNRQTKNMFATTIEGHDG